MRPNISNVIFNSTGNGIAVQISKAFNGVIKKCIFTGNFTRHIDLHGSDIMSIEKNRFFGVTEVQIYISSYSNFGSQTKIEHNDMISMSSGATSYTFSSDRDVIITNNYFEQYSGSAAYTVVIILNSGLYAKIVNNRIEIPSISAPKWLVVNNTMLLLDVGNNVCSNAPLGDLSFTNGYKYFYNTLYRARIVAAGNTRRIGYSEFPFISKEFVELEIVPLLGAQTLKE